MLLGIIAGGEKTKQINKQTLKVDEDTNFRRAENSLEKCKLKQKGKIQPSQKG